MQMHDNLTSPPVDITVFDDDVASVVTAESVMASELGDSRSFVFSLALGSQPRANVTLVPQVDASDVLLFNESFVFTPSNWNIAQTAHGLVYDDEIDEGEVEIRPISQFLSSADGLYNNLTVPPIDVYIRDSDVSPLPEGFHIAGVAVGPTTGNTRLMLVPEFREPNATHKAYLFGEFAAQFEIDARVFDVARQRRVMSTGCTWVRAAANDTTRAHASCLTPAVPFPGNAFSYELQVRWSRRGFTAWLYALEPFEYHLPVGVTRSSPNGSPVFGGSHIRVQAANFMTIAGVTPACVFRPPQADEGDTSMDVYVPAEIVTVGLLACTAPALRAGIGQLRVTVNGQQPSASYVPFTFYYNNCSSATHLGVTSGPTTGGTVLLIDGQGFVNTDILCTFVPIPESTMGQTNLSANVSVVGTFVSEEQLMCTSPPVPHEAAGSFALTLSLNGGQDQCTGPYEPVHFDYYRTPKIQTMEPPMVPVVRHGDNVTASTPLLVVGTGFNQTGVLLSQFGTENVSACTIVNDSAAVCFAPASHAGGRVAVQLSLNGVNWSNASDPTADTNVYLTYVPTVTSYYPSLGPRTGGTNISVHGYGFVPAGPRGAPSCVFGQQHVAAQFVSSTQLFCTTPAESSNAGPLGVDIGVSVGGEFINFAATEFWMHRTPVVQGLVRFLQTVILRLFWFV
jgi:hypothetical protein